MKRIVLSMIAAVAVMTCGPGVGPTNRGVGGACISDNDCVKRCVTGNDHYPGGMCTILCSSERDCPGGSTCVSDAGGICAPTCQSPSDCVQYGRGFTCDV